MAEDPERPAQTLQHEEDANEETVERNELLREHTDGQEEQEEAASDHSHPRDETSRPHRMTRSCSTEGQASQQPFRCWHDGIESSEVEEFIYAQPCARQSQLFVPEDADCGAWASPSYPKCPASFGDQGTTATAGAFGQLVQFGDYLGAGNSGMFSASHYYAERPYLVQERARDLLCLALEPFENSQRQENSTMFGLKFRNLDLLDNALPRLTWLQYRWARYEYKGRCFNSMEDVGLTIQFIVRNRIVYQQCILENRGETDVDLVLAFCKGVSISDLDHVTNDYEFNKTTSNYENAGPGPGGFGWVHVNRFRGGSPGAQTESQRSMHETKSNSSHSNRENTETNYGVALVVSMAVNGEVVRFSPGQAPHIWKQTLKARSRTPGGRCQKLEIVTAYKLVLLANPLSDWRTFVVPLKEMNPSKFLREASAVSSFSTSITSISENDDLTHTYDTQRSDTLKEIVSEEVQAGLADVSQDGTATVGSQPQAEPSPAVDHDPISEKTSRTMDHIEFTTRRNLEHILGVCAIPVAVHVFGEIAERSTWKKLRDLRPIALTCGDLSGHRISTAGSFFAFQFLAEIAKRLSRLSQPDRNETHVQTLLCRIKDVCLGHLKWLYAVEKTEKDEVFGSLYWVSGEAVNLPESSPSWAPRRHVRQTAFQILKATIFAGSFRGDDVDSSLIGEMISQWGRGWVRWLERSDRRESLTWDHKEDQGLKVFRLDDHVWIWRALKAMEDKRLGAWEILCGRAQCNDKSSLTDYDAPDVDEMLRCRRKLASQAVQREVLRNFTAEHKILRKRMVALTRSPRDTRFLLHARDTALLYGQDMGFFTEDTSILEAWKNTIDAQQFHENNQEVQWDNALRYALAIMLGIRGHQINNKEPGHMVRAATEVLLRSSSENGLFPGKLDITTKGPLEKFFYRVQVADSYYAACFEIPYLFLIHAKDIESLFVDPVERASAKASRDVNLRHYPTGEHPNSTAVMPAYHNLNSSPQVQPGQSEENRELQKLLAKVSDVLSVLSHRLESTSASDFAGSTEPAVNGRLALKKAIPFSNTIDSHSIVEIEDEWLFNYPQFLNSEKDENISMDKVLDSLEDSDVTWLSSIDVADMRRKYSSHNSEYSRSDNQSKASSRYSSSSITHGSSSTSSYYNSFIATETSISLGAPGDTGLRVIEQGKGPNNVTECHMGSFEFVWERISRPRTVAKAKKRMFLWSSEVTDLDSGPEAALLCCAASEGEERKNMLQFFERHFRHENFMFDYCNLAYNNWETELHFGFFVLKDTPEPLSGNSARNFESFPGVQGKHISRGSGGFRFHGDAFDRYWTHHFFINGNSTVESNDVVFDRFISDNISAMFQRKVIELWAFSIVLDCVKFSTVQILAEVKSELGIKSGAFSWSIPSMDTYSSWSKLWEGSAPLLQALADDLTSAQDLIGQWEVREDARGQERPRWTLNDERKYRAIVTKGQRYLDLRKKAIQDLLNDIESLRDACTARLANAREELSFRSSQNIASFTYVTIVFLPLGFAASVFSMNGYPDAGWVASMVVIAVVALTITATALANAKLLLGVADQYSKDAQRLTGDVFRSSLIGQQQKQRDEQVQASPELNKSSHGERKGGDPRQSHTTRHVLFWMAYLLIELPARRVALACRALPASLMHGLGLLRPDSKPPSEVGSIGGSSGKSTAAVGRKVIRVAGGLLILPLLLISWTLQLLFYNILDILTLLGRLTRKTFYALVAPSDAHGTASDTKMVSWLIDPPSSLRPVRKLMSREKKDEKPSPQPDMPVATDRSDSGSLEQV